MQHWKTIVEKALSGYYKKTVNIDNIRIAGGGSINDAYTFHTDEGNFFVKINSASRYPQMFEKEAKGLNLLRSAGEIPVPETVLYGEEEDTAFLILKEIKSGARSSRFWENFGKNLARLHRHGNDRFGLDHDNYIGSLVQINDYCDSWSEFFITRRLEFQIKMARNSGRIGSSAIRSFERFFSKVEEIFPEEKPVLIHGDLWSGNFMTGSNGEAVIIDPAVYYGHREMDLGMSLLFGGFDSRFYSAYNEEFPLEPEWQERMDYCNLYPLMVHVNLFGGGYLSSVERILNKFR